MHCGPTGSIEQNCLQLVLRKWYEECTGLLVASRLWGKQALSVRPDVSTDMSVRGCDSAVLQCSECWIRAPIEAEVVTK